MDKCVRFDWAAKRMLRDKANFGVLEGLASIIKQFICLFLWLAVFKHLSAYILNL